MEQHPVPQPITSYEFRLVGDMTIKQFGKLAAGIILALVVYAVNPPALLKWFLIFIFAGLGAAMAFVPFEGRPIDVWIIAFLKRIYSPTQYLWRQRSKLGNRQIVGPSSISSTPPTSPPSISVATNTLEKTLVNPNPPVSPSVNFQEQAVSQPVSPPVLEQPRIMEQPKVIFTPQSPKPVMETVLKAPVQKTQPTFIPGLTIPSTPSMPNLLVGFVLNKEKKLVEAAILEIRDSTGIPVRAFKTNKLGQFLSATPLSNGVYEIETEKEGLTFDIIRIELKGEIIPPIEIISK